MFECLLLCLALCVLGIGCAEMSSIGMILVFMSSEWTGSIYCRDFCLLIHLCVL